MVELQAGFESLPTDIQTEMRLSGFTEAQAAARQLRADIEAASGTFSLTIAGEYIGKGPMEPGNSLMLQHDIEDIYAAASDPLTLGFGPGLTADLEAGLNAAGDAQESYADRTASSADRVAEFAELLDDLATFLNEGLAKTINQKDVESIENVARVISSIASSIRDALEAFRLLRDQGALDSAETAAAFTALTDAIDPLLLRMKGLAQFAGRRSSSDEYLNMFDIENIERLSGAIDAGTRSLRGLLDVVAALPDDGEVPDAQLITDLQPLLEAVALIAVDLGEDFGADLNLAGARAVSTVLQEVTSALAKVAELDLSEVSDDALSNLDAVTANAKLIIERTRELAARFQREAGVEDDHPLVVAMQDYAAALEAGSKALQAAGAINLSEAQGLLIEDLGLAVLNAGRVLATVKALAARYAEDGGVVPVVEDDLLKAIEAYSKAVQAAAKGLEAAGTLDLSEAQELDFVKLGLAVRKATVLEATLISLAGRYKTLEKTARDRLLAAAKAYSDVVQAAAKALETAGTTNLSEAQELDDEGLDIAKRNAVELQRSIDELSAIYQDLTKDQRSDLTDSAKAAADIIGAGAKALADAVSLTLADVEPIDTTGLQTAEDNARELAAALDRLATDYRAAEDAGEHTAAAASNFADVVSAAASALVDAGTLSLGIVEPVDVGRLRRAGDNVAELVRELERLSQRYRDAEDRGEAVAEAASNYANAAGSALSIFRDAAGISSDLADASALPGDKLLIVSDNIEAVFARLALAASRYDSEAGRHFLETITLYADAAEAALGAFTSAGGLSEDLATASAVPPEQLEIARENIERAVSELRQLASDLRAEFDTDADFESELDRLGLFADAASDAVSLLADSAEALATIRSSGGGDATQLIRQAEGQITEILRALVRVSEDIGVESAKAAAEIGAAIGPATEGLLKSTELVETFLDGAFFSRSRRRGRFSQEAFQRRLREAIKTQSETLIEGINSIEGAVDPQKQQVLTDLAAAYGALGDTSESIAELDVRAAMEAAKVPAILLSGLEDLQSSSGTDVLLGIGQGLVGVQSQAQAAAAAMIGEFVDPTNAGLMRMADHVREVRDEIAGLGRDLRDLPTPGLPGRPGGSGTQGAGGVTNHFYGDVHVTDRETAEELGLLDAQGGNFTP